MVLCLVLATNLIKAVKTNPDCVVQFVCYFCNLVCVKANFWSFLLQLPKPSTVCADDCDCIEGYNDPRGNGQVLSEMGSNIIFRWP